MLKFVKGNLFDSQMQTLVNPVNTVGVMGAGLALQFKQRYPQMFQRYAELCKSNSFVMGQLWLYRSKNLPWVLCFPTKTDWRKPSRPEWIALGMQKLVDQLPNLGITSLAVPPLGAGLGGLDFDLDVRPILEDHLLDLPIPVEVYL